jgi:hypothetical protein
VCWKESRRKRKRDIVRERVGERKNRRKKGEGVGE